MLQRVCIRFCIPRKALLRDFFVLAADHYGSAEIIFVRLPLFLCGILSATNMTTRAGIKGQFREASVSKEDIVGATKWCVFKRINPSRSAVQAAVQERMERMGTTRVDLLQVRDHVSQRNYKLMRGSIFSFTGRTTATRDI